MRRSGIDGTAPDGWRMVRLGDVCAPPEYGANAAALPFDPDLPRFVRITDITDEGRLRPSDARSANPAKVLGYELGSGDLLFARSGSVGRTYLYRPEDGPCVFAGYLIRFRPKPDLALPRFVDIYTHSGSYHRWVASMLRVGAQPNINATEYSSLPILLPPLPEQRAIAAVLDAIDDAIERTDSVIAATEHLRDALLHDLLSHGVPGWHSAWRDMPGLGTIPADWEVVQLGDVAEVDTGGTPSRSEPLYWGGSIPWMASGEINQRRVRETAEQITKDGLRSSNAKIFPRGTAMIAMNGQGTTRGKACVLDIDAACNQSLAAVRSGMWCRNQFLFHLLDSAYDELRRITGEGRNGLNLSLIRRFRIPLPSLDEQKTICTILDSTDAVVERVSNERDELQSLKASVADALLSGRVRMEEMNA